MKKILSTLVLSGSTWIAAGQQPAALSDSAMIASIYNETMTHAECYENLRHLCKNIGHRLAGSESAQRAIDWGKTVLEKSVPGHVMLMPVEVPHWTRGAFEFGGYATDGIEKEVALTALGGSVGTEGKKITAQVIEVKNFDELKALGEDKVKGKIVFFNKPLDATLINTGAAYGGGYPIRGQGPSEAAKLGAVACLIRSLTLADDNFPHTGATNYEKDVTRIPAAALSAVASRQLSQDLKNDPTLQFSLQLSCEAFDRTMQANVIAEIPGTEFPGEYITVGGHLDSWDIGEGAHDDGTGIVQSIEMIRTLQAIGYKPKRTIRAVLFINEEFGNDGGETYAKRCKENGLVHVAAIESDGGGFTPVGFNCDLSDKQYELAASWLPLLEPYNLFRFRRGGSGVDIRPLKDDRIALFGLNVDGQRYFDYHHTNNDRFENVNKRELELGAAAMTALVYLLDQSGIPAQ
ncbi:MAG: M28 family peptidase [Flavobacteriales bacterium]|jgi:carboxypeptidase Q